MGYKLRLGLNIYVLKVNFTGVHVRSPKKILPALFVSIDKFPLFIIIYQ